MLDDLGSTVIKFLGTAAHITQVDSNMSPQVAAMFNAIMGVGQTLNVSQAQEAALQAVAGVAQQITGGGRSH